uniref:Gag-Pol polyprotein n=1 Tax=Tanacetum cinerariifolium TaxID=118510 RepID=A0A699JT55_TANCI|nr:hypothetical protein [Tanacetum cinerariifolium]
MFTSNEGEFIESYYHRFLKLMNDLKRNKHFPEKIAGNLKFLNNLQPEWSRHVTIVHQTKDLHTADYTQLYDFLKYNQKEVDELKAVRFEKIQDPLALMANSNNPYTFLAPQQDQSPFNQNYLQQPMPNPEDITDSTTTMNMALNAGNPAGYNHVIENQVNQNAVQNQRIPNVGNKNGLIGVQGNGHYARNCTFRPRRRDAAYLQTQLLIAQKEEYTELLEPIFESHQVPQNDNDVISEDTNVEQGRETVEQHTVNFEETRALYESLYQNLATKVEKANSVNPKFVGDFKSLANEADTSLAKQKALEFEIKRLLKAVVS